MKLNLRDFVDRSEHENLRRRKKDQDAEQIDTAIKAALVEFEDYESRRAAFLALLTHVRSCTGLVKPIPRHGTPGWVGPVFMINRLKSLATRQNLWFRPCESWQPAETNLRLAFRSLAHHLLADYSVPGFMDSAWDVTTGAEAFRQQSWFIRLGRGSSFRSLNLPLALTRRMEHHVRQAPDHFTAYQALRYGEVIGLGGDQKLAREVAVGRLGQRIEHSDFWRTVLRFLVDHPELKLEHVNPIVDFIQAQKFGGEDVDTEHGRTLRAAPWTDFSMKGRTVKSILRLLAVWHTDFAANKPGTCFSWRTSRIDGYRFLERRDGHNHDREWTIQELTDSGALHAEGKEMRHCVYSYADRCWRGETTIWSLRLRIDGEEKRMVTLEVDPRRRAIVQARAKCNRWPGERSAEIIQKWATEGLGSGLHVMNSTGAIRFMQFR